MPLEPPVTIAARSAMCSSGAWVFLRARESNQLPSGTMRAPRQMLLAGSVLAALAIAGCGGGGDDGTGAKSSDTAPAVAAKAADFPKGDTLTYTDVRGKYGDELNLAGGAAMINPGSTRLPFLILDAGAKVVKDAQVAVYTMKNDGTGVRGPFPARDQPFDIGPAYLSRTTSSDPQQQKFFYVADLATEAGKPVAAFAIVKAGGKTLATTPTSIGLKTKKADEPPAVGDRAISMKTLTPDDVGGDYKKLTTRVPPDKDLVQTNLADVLGKKPVVLIFATPALCQSRVCGPTVDVAEQVKGDFGDKVAWVHQEIYQDDDPNKGLRPQVSKWRLQTEPWVYVIGRDGTIANRVEGAISVPELKAMVGKIVAS